MIKYSWPEVDYTSVIKQRVHVLKKIRAAIKHDSIVSDMIQRGEKLPHGAPRDLFKKICAHYASHPVDFINGWVWTYNPKMNRDRFRPLVLFPRQVEFIEFLEDNRKKSKPCVCEKSREVGMSWCIIAYAAWNFIFKEDFSQGFGSQVERKVDTLGDPDSLLEKMDMVLRNLPLELRPRYTRFHLRIRNAANGSIIKGESGDGIGRGGRQSAYYIDESAFLERPEAKEAALSATADFQVDVSTHNGTDSLFFKKVKNPYFPTFKFHWRDDPRKDDEWYKAQCERFADVPHIIAQEIDMDPFAAKDGVVLPASWVRAAIGLELDESGEKIGSLDVSDLGGADSCALAIAYGPAVKKVYEWSDKLTGDSMREAYGICKEWGVNSFRWDKLGVGAGVTSEIEMIRRNCKKGSEPFIFKHTWAYAGSGKPTAGFIVEGTPNSDMFENLKAESWWLTRLRLKRTYEHVTGKKEHSPDQMISLPAGDERLVEELCQATWSRTQTGKIRIDKLGDGNKSPNKADSVVMYCAQQPRAFVVF